MKKAFYSNGAKENVLPGRKWNRCNMDPQKKVVRKEMKSSLHVMTGRQRRVPSRTENGYVIARLRCLFTHLELISHKYTGNKSTSLKAEGASVPYGLQLQTEEGFNKALIPQHEAGAVTADLMIMPRIVLASLSNLLFILFIISFIYYLGKLTRILLIMNFNRINGSVGIISSEYWGA